jgi:hypothetical protein
MAEIKIHLPAAAHIESWPTIAPPPPPLLLRNWKFKTSHTRVCAVAAGAIIYADDAPAFPHLDCTLDDEIGPRLPKGKKSQTKIKLPKDDFSRDFQLIFNRERRLHIKYAAIA